MNQFSPAILQLAQHDHWVVWKYQLRDGRTTKPPYQVNGCYADTTDPMTWAPLAQVVAGRAAFDGIGFVVTGTPYCGIDLDDCVTYVPEDDGRFTVAPWAQSIVDMFRSYTELTPSQHGARVWVRGEVPGGRKRSGFGEGGRGSVEIYSGANPGRFFTITRVPLPDTPLEIHERQAELDAFYAQIFGTSDAAFVAEAPATADRSLDDDALLDRIRQSAQGDRFGRLWTGDWKGAGYASCSEADLALANMLAFWTGRDAARMDRLFRRSGLMRDKWGSRRGTSTYGALTIQKTIADCVNTYAGSSRTVHGAETEAREPEDPNPQEQDPDDPKPPSDEPHLFASAFPEDHFVSHVIEYASGRTDAAQEYHELGACVLLGEATPGIRARLGMYPEGLSTALYGLIIGNSTRSRKSTSIALYKDLADQAFPGHRLADLTSPEGFVEQLAEISPDPTAWYIDEFSGLLEKLHHARYMAGLREILMTLYMGPALFAYRRHTKRLKGGGRVSDHDVIHRAHLSILGGATPSIFSLLDFNDVLSGLLPRFTIAMPTRTPPRKPFYAASDPDLTNRDVLVTWLTRLRAWSTADPRPVHFDREALEILDGFALRLETLAEESSDHVKPMLHRLQDMAIKVAMLSACGRPEILSDASVTVTPEDARTAITVGGRWQTSAIAFAERIGESGFERNLQHCLSAMGKQRKVTRTVVARATRLDKKMLDLVEATLADRGQIRIHRSGGEFGRPATTWNRLS